MGNGTAERSVPVMIGTAGWSYPDWNGIVYPGGEKNKLGWLARYMDCVEIDTSFYRPFTPGMAEKWLWESRGNEQFRFTAKLWRRLTHEIEKPYTAEEVQLVRGGLEPLGKSRKLLGLLMQFPFYFRDSDQSRDLLKRLADDFKDYPKVLEVRDASWGKAKAMEFIRSLEINVACLDMPIGNDSFREWARTTGPIGYLRLHGRNRKAWFSKNADRDDRYNYLYTDKELDQIIQRTEELRKSAQMVVVIWNNHFKGKAAVNALQMLSRMQGERPKAPETLRKFYPELGRVTESEQPQTRKEKYEHAWQVPPPRLQRKFWQER